MQRHGIETKIIDAQQETLDHETIQSIRKFNPDFTCSFNSFEPMDEKRYLWDFLKIPHLSFLVDPSFYSTKLINSPYSIISCVDRSDCEVIATNAFERVFSGRMPLKRSFLQIKMKKESMMLSCLVAATIMKAYACRGVNAIPLH